MNKIKEVCLIDDDNIQVFLMEKFLNKTGLVERVSKFDNGKSAYDGLKSQCEEKSQCPDLIFLDLNMPIWDGWIFYEEFMKLECSKKSIIYILTSSLSEGDSNKAKTLGLGERYLCKPLDYNGLNKIISDNLN